MGDTTALSTVTNDNMTVTPDITERMTVTNMTTDITHDAWGHTTEMSSIITNEPLPDDHHTRDAAPVITTIMSLSITDETPGDDRSLLIHTTTSLESHNMAPLGLLVIIIVTLTGNAILCLAVKMDRRLHHMTYYFLVSMATLHGLMSVIVMPPAILVVLTGEYTVVGH